MKKNSYTHNIIMKNEQIFGKMYEKRYLRGVNIKYHGYSNTYRLNCRHLYGCLPDTAGMAGL